jgi:uncharacterized protein (UPF0276 family)
MTELLKTGIGLRAAHTLDVIAGKPSVGFLEGHAENYFRIGGIPFEQLMKCRADYAVSLHGVGLSLGSAGGVSAEHLSKLATLVEAVDPVLVSEHVSWSSADGKSVPDLLPLPMTNEALGTICANVSHVQDVLKRTILVENPSSYLAFTQPELEEPAFLAEIAKRTGCGLLLDVNNIHVSGHNLGFDAQAYIAAIPKDIVKEIHLAGYQINGDVFIDAHNQAVHEPVWALYRDALARFGDTPTIIEWDSDLPTLARLVAEAQKADVMRDAARKGRIHARVA